MFRDFGGARRGGRGTSTRGGDLRYNLEISLEDAFGGREVKFTCRRHWYAKPAVRAPKTVLSRRPVRRAKAQVRAQQGFFTIERTCATCHGQGRVIDDPYHECGGSGRVRKEKKLSVNVPPGVDDGTRIGLPVRVRPGCVAARREISTYS